MRRIDGLAQPVYSEPATMEARMHYSKLVTATAVALGASMYAAPAAEACGGFFCGQTPVVQTGEQIIFTVDHQADTTEAVINIAYQGQAEEFAWLLPLTVAPTNVRVGANQAFAMAAQLTQPRFQITEVEERGICGQSVNNRFDSAGGPPQASTGAETDPDDGVNVIDQREVGPYDTVQLTGDDPEKVREWLVEAGYRVTDDMMDAVVPYVAKGDVLLALKLRKEQDTGDIQPIWLSLPRAEACIPLRLTAIAAQSDMDVLAYVFSNEGRAIPRNYFHVQPNLAKIDWLRGGNNYRQLIAQAADEAGGNAFTTEFAGNSEIFKEQIWQEGRYNAAALRQHTDLGRFLDEVNNQNLRFRAETRSILMRNFPELENCPRCPSRQFYGVTIDPTAAVAELETRIFVPEEQMQTLLDQYSFGTRLYTLISPEEMTMDPFFDFDATLPNVSNQHNAKMILHCGVGGSPGSAGVEIVLEDGTVIGFDNNITPNRAALDAMPSAAVIEQLAEGSVVMDNKPAIKTALDTHNGMHGATGCGCDASEGERSTPMSLAFAGLLAMGLVLRRRF